MAKKASLPLSKTHPKLAKEAYGWDPSNYSYGSSKKMKWICSKGHTFEAFIYSRAVRGDKCPICSGKKVLKGFNDLVTTHPELAKQAHNWNPEEFSAGSNKKVLWKCFSGHTWTTTILNRSFSNSNCPVCTNRKVISGENDLATTHPEIAEKADGWDPSQVSFGSGKKVKWKCDLGHNWSTSVAKARKSGCPYCSNRKVKIGFNDLNTTHPKIASQAHGWNPKSTTAGNYTPREWKCDLGHIWKVSPEVRTLRNSGCPYCSNNKVMVGFNDLQTLFPEIASQSHGWDPREVIPGSNKKLEWICTLGHVWSISPDQRTGKAKSGCPICSNKKLLVGFNDLATRFPELAKEAYGWDPTTIISGHIKKNWRCVNGHKWASDVLSRTSQNIGCPSCAKYGFNPNNYGYLYLLKHNSWQMLQIGITNTPEDRLSDHKKLGWEIIETRGPMEGHLTQQWETAMLRMLKAKGADLSNKEIAGKFDGYSEAWSKSTFEVKSIKELMRLTEEFEGNI